MYVSGWYVSRCKERPHVVPCRYLDLGSYAEWDEEKRIEFLTRELEGKRPLIPTAMPMTNDVKEVRLQKAHPATAQEFTI